MVASTVLSMKARWPRQLLVAVAVMLAFTVSCPAALSRRTSGRLCSGIPKVTWMGANCSSVTSVVSLSLTMLPAFTITAPARPLMGATISVKLQLQLGLGETRAVGLGRAGRSLDRCLIGMQSGAGGVTGGDKLIHALSGDDAERAEFPGDVGLRLALLFCGSIARHNRAGLLLHRDVALQFGLLLQRLTFERLAIDGEEQLALGYVLSFDEVDAVDLPGNARLHLDAVDRLDIADCRDLQGNIL